MASALTVLFLGCWLAGHSGAWGEPSYPKPNISLNPSWGVSLGGAVAVWCRGQHQGMRFVLNKEGRHFPPVDPKGFEAVFPISNVRREDGGSYNCSYHSRSKPSAASSPSDPVELVVRDPSLPRPSVSLSPTRVTAPGANVTIRCQGQSRDVRFFLHKAGDLNPPRHMDPAGDGAEFHIPTVGRQHGGSYSCSYRPRSEPFVSSQPSDPVQLVVAEPSYPKPSISLSPSWGVSLGGAVAVWCRGQHQGMRFVLNKEGRHFPPVDPDGLEAEFSISNVSREDGGSYNCSYHNRSKPSAASSPSDPVELVVRACLLCADPSLPRPSISLSPTGVTAPGANVTIRCRGQSRDVRFFLHKAGDLNPPRHMDPAGDGAEFPIPTVGRQHGGSYSCSYRPPSDPFVSSQPSDPVQLVVAEPSYPKPSISLSPSGGVSLGEAVSVWCRGQHQGVRFVLNKEGRHFPAADPKGLEAVFSISNVSWDDRGSYSCSYHSRSGSAAASSPSDPVELVVRDPSLPRPSISLSPTGVTAPGVNVTIWCQGQPRDVRFFLHKAGDLNPPRHMDPAGDGAEFHIPTVGRQHGGSYSCSYRPRSDPFVSSQPSHPVQLVVADPSLPRPSISLSPTGVTAPGANVTIRCQGQSRDVRFFLHKAGDLNPPRHMDPAGDGAEFCIPTVGRQHGGSYSCSYRPRSEPFVSSQPSHPVQLVVAEPSYPKPSISLSPSGGVSLGEAVSVWCRGQHQGMRFVLNKEGRHFPAADPKGLEAVFSISNVSWDDRGSYSCSYHSRSGSAAASSPSDPVELVVRDPSLPRPSISLSPTGVTAPGVNVTIWCQGQPRDVRFFLHKAGDLNPPRHMDPAGDGAEFHIPTVGRQHGGSYSCSYRPRSDPFVSSQPSHPPSDPVELVVADPSLPRPSISLSPTGVTAPGANVTIRCQGQSRDVRFFLHKAGDLNPPRHMDPAGDGAEFCIPTVGRQHGGSYSCSYRPPSEPFVSSQPSHPVQLVVAEPSYPKPSISLSPSWGVSLGEAVSVWCRGQHQGVRFLLNKEGRHFPPVDPKGLEAVFSISNVRWDDRGSYSCSYHSRSGSAAASSPSDPVELVVRDPSLPRPSISLSPTGVTAPGVNVTIWCQGQPRDVRFFLHKAGDLNPPRHMDPAGDGAEFHIPTVGRQHGGSYSCSYRPRSDPFVSSQPSHPVQLVVADPSLPRPSISLSPTGVTAPGANVTIRCQGQSRDVRFFLHKAGDLNPPRHMDPAGDGAEFCIPTVGRQHGGSYSCSYQPPSEPFVSSQPSHPVQLVVAEPSYPKPSISLSPSGGVSLGEAVSVWCRGQHQGVRFVLNKEGRHFPAADPKGFEAVFSISNVSWDDRGSYSCSYHSRSGSAAASSPSDPVELVVRDPSLPRPSISLSPTGVTAPGVNVTIWCQGQPRDVRFFLHKAGDLNPPRHMDPAGDGAEFHIPTVGRQHGGSYSCSYRPRSEPFVSSQPSHPVQLVVAAAPPGHQDFTYANIASLVLSAMVLLVKGLIPAETYYSRPREVP
ncbi:unnamed protein product [Eretmochelys imbricata]